MVNFSINCHFSSFLNSAGEYKVNNVHPTPEGENTKVKIKTRIDLSGLFMIRSAVAYEKGEEIEVWSILIRIDFVDSGLLYLYWPRLFFFATKQVPAPEEPMEVENGNGGNANGPTPADTAEAPETTNNPNTPEDVTMASDPGTDLPSEAPAPVSKPGLCSCFYSTRFSSILGS